VPITLEPRSPYFALLDFCHFKASEISERQGQLEKREKERGVLLVGKTRSMLNLMPPRRLPAIKRETGKLGGKISRTINFKVNLEIEEFAVTRLRYERSFVRLEGRGFLSRQRAPQSFRKARRYAAEYVILYRLRR